MLAFRLPEEIPNQTGQLLNAAQRADGQPFHLSLVGDQLARHLAFDVRPCLFVRIQMRRVWRQEKQLELAVLFGDEALHRRGLVDGVDIDDEKDGLFGAGQEPLEERDEDIRINRSFIGS